jgi:hypothetical protein
MTTEDECRFLIDPHVHGTVHLKPNIMTISNCVYGIHTFIVIFF